MRRTNYNFHIFECQDDCIISACEYENINIGCTHEKKLNIRKAIYCYHNTNACCSSDNTTHIVIGLCDNKPHCQFQVNRYIFGDQCNKSENNLTIYYTCEGTKPGSSHKCKRFEEWSSTASTCPKMCPSIYEQPKECEVYEGCTCKKDYVLDRNTMTCMPEQYCPKTGEKNERYSRCGAASQRYCPGPIEYEKEKFQECIPGYVCRKYLYRNIAGCCVPSHECPGLKG